MIDTVLISLEDIRSFLEYPEKFVQQKNINKTPQDLLEEFPSLIKKGIINQENGQSIYVQLLGLISFTQPDDDSPLTMHYDCNLFIELITLFIEELNVDINTCAKTNQGYSAIHFATITNNIEFINYLAEKGADFNLYNRKASTFREGVGRRPLFLAKSLEAIKALIAGGGDLFLASNDLNTEKPIWNILLCNLDGKSPIISIDNIENFFEILVTYNIEIPFNHLRFLDVNSYLIDKYDKTKRTLNPTNFKNYGILIKRTLLKNLKDAINLDNSNKLEIPDLDSNFNSILRDIYLWNIIYFFKEYKNYLVQDFEWCHQMLGSIQSLLIQMQSIGSKYTGFKTGNFYPPHYTLELNALKNTLSSSVPAPSDPPSHPTETPQESSTVIIIEESNATPPAPKPLSLGLELSGMAVVIGLIAGAVMTAIVHLITLNTVAALAAGIATTIVVTASLTAAKSCFFNQAPKKMEKESFDLTQNKLLNFD